MLSSTIEAVNHAIRESVPSVPNPRAELVDLATDEVHRVRCASTPEEARAHTLRALAYLVRRLELDAPEEHEVDLGCARPVHAGPAASCKLCHPPSKLDAPGDG